MVMVGMKEKKARKKRGEKMGYVVAIGSTGGCQKE